MTDYTTYIKMAQVFANTTFLEVYLFDFAERRLVFASPTILKHRKIQTKKVSGEECRMDIDKVLPMNQDEQTALSAAAQKYKELSPDRQKDFVIHINTRPSRNVMAKTHRLSIVTTDEHNNPILVMGIVSPSLHGGADTMVAHVATEDFIYRYIYGSGEWVCEPLPHLSDNELTMLRFTLQGYSLENIGQLMYKSTESVKYYRRQVYQKLGANNIAEALGIAADYCLLQIRDSQADDILNLKSPQDSNSSKPTEKTKDVCLKRLLEFLEELSKNEKTSKVKGIDDPACEAYIRLLAKEAGLSNDDTNLIFQAKNHELANNNQQIQSKDEVSKE